MLAWVVGSGGLLGSHLVKVLKGAGSGFEFWDPGPSGIPWMDPDQTKEALGNLADRFAQTILRRGEGWILAWCAGVGVVGSDAPSLALETDYLRAILSTLEMHLASHPGKVLLSSSAGGVYGDNPEQPLTETSRCQPISAYGRNKLLQEAMLAQWASRNPLASTLIARISNLYGPGLEFRRPKGLLAQVSRCMLHHEPIHVFVPLDTLRDYIWVEDCAAMLVCALQRLRLSPPEHVTKIFHGGRTTSLASIIGGFARIAKGHPRIVCAPTTTRFQQPSRLQFQSTVWEDLPRPVRTDLSTGILKLHMHQLMLFQRGLLPPGQSG